MVVIDAERKFWIWIWIWIKNIDIIQKLEDGRVKIFISGFIEE